MDTKKIIGIVILLVIFAGGWYFLTAATVPAPTKDNNAVPGTPNGGADTSLGTDYRPGATGGQSKSAMGDGLILGKLDQVPDEEIMRGLEFARTKANSIQEQLSNAVRSGNIKKPSGQYDLIAGSLSRYKKAFSNYQTEAILRGLTIS